MTVEGRLLRDKAYMDLVAAFLQHPTGNYDMLVPSVRLQLYAVDFQILDALPSGAPVQQQRRPPLECESDKLPPLARISMKWAICSA